MGEIARSKSIIVSDLKTRDSNRWRPCDLKLRFETRDWRFVLNTPIQRNCEKGCDLSPRSKIASDWRLAILPIFFVKLNGSRNGIPGKQVHLRKSNSQRVDFAELRLLQCTQIAHLLIAVTRFLQMFRMNSNADCRLLLSWQRMYRITAF